MSNGIDLHSNNNVVTLLDEKDQVIYQRRLGNDLSTILSELTPYQEALQGLAQICPAGTDLKAGSRTTWTR